MDKKHKAEDKRIRRAQRKQEAENPPKPTDSDDAVEPSDGPNDMN